MRTKKQEADCFETIGSSLHGKKRIKQMEKSMFQTAVILAGGHSSRMGFDKQLLEFRNRHLAMYLAEELHRAFQEVLIVTKTPELYKGTFVRTCGDLYPGQGPISGIHSAFCHCQSDVLFVMACDMTQFHLEYASYQAKRMQQEQTEACVTLRDGKLENFHAFYHRSLLEDMEERLKIHRTSIFRFLESRHVTRISENEVRAYTDPERLFRNLNTPQDYEKFRNN